VTRCDLYLGLFIRERVYCTFTHLVPTMTSYLRSWLYSGTSTVEPTPDSDPVPIIERVSPPPDEEDDGEETETERKDDDRPPAFPALNSAQRAQTSQLRPAVLTDSQLMPPPPLPSLAQRLPGTASRANMLAAPPRTLKPPAKPSKKREKVALAPGFGPLDWAALKSSGTNLRVSTLFICVTFHFCSCKSTGR